MPKGKHWCRKYFLKKKISLSYFILVVRNHYYTGKETERKDISADKINHLSPQTPVSVPIKETHSLFLRSVMPQAGNKALWKDAHICLLIAHYRCEYCWWILIASQLPDHCLLIIHVRLVVTTVCIFNHCAWDHTSLPLGKYINKVNWLINNFCK